MLHVNVCVTFEKGCTYRSSLLQQLLRIIIIIVYMYTVGSYKCSVEVLSYMYTTKVYRGSFKKHGQSLTPRFICFHVQLHKHNFS